MQQHTVIIDKASVRSRTMFCD